MYKISELLKLDNRLYHSNDLAILWNISNRNTLYTTIKRYVGKGVLIPVFKGLYSTVPIDKLDPLELGQAIIHNKAYLSTESVLVKHGVIAQNIYVYTFVSSVSRKITVGGSSFLCRKLQYKFLNNPVGIVERNRYYEATIERAVADMLYFNPKYTFDVPGVLDWRSIKTMQRELGYING